MTNQEQRNDHEQRISRLEHTVEQILSRLDDLTQRVSRLEGVVEQLSARINNQTIALIGGWATIMPALIAILLTEIFNR